MNIIKTIKEYFDIKKKVEKLRKEKEWLDDHFTSLDKIEKQRDLARSNIKNLEWRLKEVSKELEEYKDKYALLRASVLGIKEENRNV